jgi:hypothetical protein
VIQGSELDFGVVLICLSTLAKKLSLLRQIHFQSRSFRMKGQSSSFSTAPGLVETDVLISSDLPRGGPFLSVLWALGGLCVGFVWSGSSESVPRREHPLDLRCKACRMNTCTKTVGGTSIHIRAYPTPIDGHQERARSSAKHCEGLPMQVEYCERGWPSEQHQPNSRRMGSAG